MMKTALAIVALTVALAFGLASTTGSANATDLDGIHSTISASETRFRLVYSPSASRPCVRVAVPVEVRRAAREAFAGIDAAEAHRRGALAAAAELNELPLRVLRPQEPVELVGVTLVGLRSSARTTGRFGWICSTPPPLITSLPPMSIVTSETRTAVGPAVPVVGMSYYNPLLVEWFTDPASLQGQIDAIAALNDVLEGQYAAAGDTVADVEGAFSSTDSTLQPDGATRRRADLPVDVDVRLR
jgi:hypothetical protein